MSRKVLIKFPACEYCNSSVGDIFFCKRCGKYSHFTCLVEITDGDRCTHKAYKPIGSTGWDVP